MKISALEKLNHERRAAMIKILKEDLDLGLDLLEKVETCPVSHNCLWLQRINLFKIADSLPEGCPKENCQVIIFRKILETDSPAFYAEALALSRFDGVLHTTIAISLKRKRAKRKKQRKLNRRIYDLHIFGQLLVLAIYPLFLEAKEVPFLKTAEIAELRDGYHDAEIRQTIKRIGELNPDWLEWIESITENLLSNYEQYPLAMTYLVYLFLKGLEKTQLPNLQEMPAEDKDKFFSEIEKMIFKKEK